MMSKKSALSSGYSLIEIMISMALTTIIMAAAIAVFRQGVSVSSAISEVTETQQNARAALNLIARDLSIAGTGITTGGIPLPNGTPSADSRFGCDSSSCYITSNTYSDDRIYGITPGNGKGVTINATTTDVVTMIYEDDSVDLNNFQLVNITAAGDEIEFNAGQNPPIQNLVAAGDVLVLCNSNGCAAGEVTGIDAVNRRVQFADMDPLNINQSTAEFGNIASLLDPPAGAAFPPTWAVKALVITYYIEVPPGADNTVGTADDGDPRLMYQVNGHAPVPVADRVEDLQFTYDTFDDNAGVPSANRDDANGAPNQIRKVNISITVRSPSNGLFNTGAKRVRLTTSVSPRNLSFRDRFVMNF